MFSQKLGLKELGEFIPNKNITTGEPEKNKWSDEENASHRRKTGVLKSRNTYETRPTRGSQGVTIQHFKGWKLWKMCGGRQFHRSFCRHRGSRLEALSQGAKFASFIEIDKEIAKTIQKNVFKRKFQTESSIINSDAMIFDYWREELKDIIFADPPYNSGMGAGYRKS